MRFAGERSRRWFAVFAWTLVAYNIPVVLWGAYVRASFSGDGCGANWPFCNGQVLPAHMAVPTAIEFTHRMMTGLDSVAVVALCVWAFAAFPSRHAVRRYSLYSLAFLLVEAFLGAGLVLFRYVAHDRSAGRAFYLSAHLTNTMLMLLAFTTTAWLARSEAHGPRWQEVRRRVFWALPVTALVSVTGAVAALGDTLFPVRSLAAGLTQDFARTSATLLRLRVMHPAIAVVGVAYVVWSALPMVRTISNESRRVAAMRVISIATLQLIAGAVNVSLLAPLWMQLSHLFVADVLWIALVVMALESVRGTSTHHVPDEGHWAPLAARAVSTHGTGGRQ